MNWSQRRQAQVKKEVNTTNEQWSLENDHRGFTTLHRKEKVWKVMAWFSHLGTLKKKRAFKGQNSKMLPAFGRHGEMNGQT